MDPRVGLSSILHLGAHAVLEDYCVVDFRITVALTPEETFADEVISKPAITKDFRRCP
jgi:hypothetical protein